MLKIRNAVLLFGSAVLLCGTLFCTVADRIGFDFPDWMSVNAKHSNLEGRNYTKFPKATVDTAMSGKFQSGLESYVSDLVPMRDKVLLTNAQLQRLSIVPMSMMVGYSDYPTFFGSGYYYDSAYNIVRAIPMKKENIKTDTVVKSIESINSFVETHPELNYLMYVPARAGVLELDAHSGLVSDAAGEDYVLDAISSKLDESVSLMHWSPSSDSEYAEKYYNSDHHWNIKAAYDAYCTTATFFGFGDELVQPVETVSFDDISFYGSAARTGLDADYDADGVIDYRFNLPVYDVWVNGKKKDEGSVNSINRYEQGSWPQEDFSNYYGDYYHKDYSQIVFANQSEDAGDKSLLIVGDSYTNCIERLYVSHYKKVYVYDPRLAKEALSEFVEQCDDDIDDIMYMMCYMNLVDKRVTKNLR